MNGPIETLLNTSRELVEKYTNAFEECDSLTNDNNTKCCEMICEGHYGSAILIRSLGFEIISCREMENGDEEFDCIYNDWNFTALKTDDPDVGEMLIVKEIQHHDTEENIEYFVDLYGKNTNGNKKWNLKRIMDLGVVDFKKEKFDSYVDLPKALKTKGFSIDTDEFVFGLDGTTNKICINGVLYLSLLDGEQTTILLEKKSKPYFDQTDKYELTRPNGENYNPIFELVSLAMEEVNGDYGYLEGNKFWKNEDVESEISAIADSVGWEMEDFSTYWMYGDTPEEEIQTKIIDHTKGIELYKKYEFEPVATENIGFRQRYSFEISYNKNVDEHNCSLKVTRSVGWDDKDGKAIWGASEQKTEYRGSVTGCLEQVRYLVQELQILFSA